MADDVAITAGSGTTIATDDASGRHIQLFKLAYSANGDATLVGVDVNGLDVDVTRLPALPAGSNNIGDVDVLTLPALPAGTNAIGKLAANSGVDIGDVDVTSLPALVAGSANIGQVDPRGNIAHDGVDAGNPVKTGGRARTALPAAVAQDDRSDTITDKFGRTLVTVAPLDQRASGKATYTNTTAADLIAAPGANIAIVVTSILVVNGSATIGTKVEIRDGTTVVAQGYAAALGGGFALQDGNGIFVATANTAVTGRNVTTGADVDVFVSGYKIPA